MFTWPFDSEGSPEQSCFTFLREGFCLDRGDRRPDFGFEVREK